MVGDNISGLRAITDHSTSEKLIRQLVAAYRCYFSSNLRPPTDSSFPGEEDWFEHRRTKPI